MDAIIHLKSQPDQNPALVYLAGLSPGSRRTMRGALDTIACVVSPGSIAESFPWASLRFQHTAAIRAHLADRYAPSTANKMLCALRGTLKSAHRLGQIAGDDYAKAVDLDPVIGDSTGPTGRAVAKGEMQRLREACAADPVRGKRDWAILCVGWGCGLRRAEIAGLQVASYEGATLQVLGKRNKRRQVPVAGFAQEALDDWLEQRGRRAAALFLGISATGQLSGGLTSQAIYQVLRKRQAEAGLQSFSPHDLRRSFVSNLLSAEVDIATVASLAGHSSVQTTARYDRRPEERKRAAVGKLSL